MSDIHDLAPFYALDALDTDDRRAFEQHLESCADCRKELEALRSGTAEVAAASAEEPPEWVRAAVFEEIDGHNTDGATVVGLDRRRSAWRSRVFQVAAAIAVVVLVGVALRPQAPSPTDLIVDAADARTLSVTGDPLGSAQLIWSDAQNGAVFVGQDLAPIDSDQAYALWLIDDAGPTPAGLFRPDAAGRATVLLTGDAGTGSTVGVTIEPSAGSAQPTGEIILLETLG